MVTTVKTKTNVPLHFSQKYKVVALDLRAHIANSHMIHMVMLSHN